MPQPRTWECPECKEAWRQDELDPAAAMNCGACLMLDGKEVRLVLIDRGGPPEGAYKDGETYCTKKPTGSG